MFYVVLNEEVLEEPFETENQAREEAERIVAKLREKGKPATFVIWLAPKAH